MLAKSKISAFVIAAAVAAGLAAPRPSAQAPAQNAPPQPARQNAFAPDGTPITLGLAGYAKVLCSAVFVSGREAAEAFENSGFFLFPEEERARRDLRRRPEEPARPHDARHDRREPRGSTATRAASSIAEGHDGIYFTPVPVKTRLPDAGDAGRGRWATRRRAGRCRPTSITHAPRRRSTCAFADPEALTAACHRRLQGPDHRRALHAGDDEGHATRKLVDGQEPDGDALRAAREGRRLQDR